MIVCQKNSEVGPLQVVTYAIRLACSMLLLEIMSHSLYFNSITRYSLWQRYGAQLQLKPVDMGIISFWVLMFVWLKVGLSFCSNITCKPALLFTLHADFAKVISCVAMYIGMVPVRSWS